MTQPQDGHAQDAQHSDGHAQDHHVLRMGGRDPDEENRTASPLELFFDLAFVVSFGIAGNEVAHLVGEGHVGAGLAGFAFVMFGVCWAWVNFTWFASAYDTDDWVFRLMTMVQMVGVLIFALGIPPLFASVDHGTHLDNAVIVLGYVVMRVALVGQWLRAAAQDPARRRTALSYAGSVSAAQVGWVFMIFIDQPVPAAFAMSGVLILVELAAPYLAELNGRTPWHAHHVAERYGLFAIIALGEGLLGTVAAIAAVVEHQGWSLEAVVMGFAGAGLTFGMWWLYFIFPSGEALHHQRHKSWVWGYGHIVVFAAIAGTGAGLHVAAYYVEHATELPAAAVVACAAVPVAVFVLGLGALYSYLMGPDPLHVWLTLGKLAVVGAAVGLAAFGLPVVWAVFVIALGPAAAVVVDELVVARRRAAALARIRAEA
jgi:low temperature requirement protein LtrA